MACSRPITAWKGPKGKSGKSTIVFDSSKAINQKSAIKLPCGKCIGCQLKRSRDWATRCVHEESMHDESMFLTLTYNKENIPKNYSLQNPPEDIQAFLKRLRKNTGKKLTYFQCGEYGEERLRPHHHMLLYGYMPKDKVAITDKGKTYWISEEMNRTWRKGDVLIGLINFESSAYVARYALKKIGIEKDIIKCMIDMIEKKYSYQDLEKVDDYFNREKPRITMSKRPAIGREWYNAFKRDCYPSDYIYIGSKKVRPPRYYDSILDIEEPEQLKEVKNERKKFHYDDSPLTPAEIMKKRYPRSWQREIVLEKLNKKKLERYREVLL